MIRVFKTKEELSKAASEIFIETAKSAIAESGAFKVALTGGSSPESIYKLLAGEDYVSEIDWSKVFIFWGDERWVPLNDESSNAGMAFNSLLKHVPIPSDQIFPMWESGSEPEKFAERYEELLRNQLGTEGRFDLILLGMGEDGHTASLFPGTKVLAEKERWVVAYYLEAQQMYRITMTEPLLNKAKKIMFMVFGAGKADALFEVLEGEKNEYVYPAQLINQESKDVFWLVDALAAARINKVDTKC